MKKTIITSLIVVMVLGIGTAFAGNGAPSGPHFNLNLIGIKAGEKYEKKMDDCDSGHRIFVQLGEPKKNNPLPTTTNINLVESEDDTFAVLDCDGTDGEATFQLPNPDPGKARTTKYSVWIRPLGSPKNDPSVRITTCATECFEWDGDVCISTGDLVCSTEYVEVTRSKGSKPTFTDATRELLTMCVWFYDEVEEEWYMERVYLFDERFVDYFWKYDNNGVKLLQIRFYYEEMEYDGADWNCRDMEALGPPV